MRHIHCFHFELTSSKSPNVSHSTAIQMKLFVGLKSLKTNMACLSCVFEISFFFFFHVHVLKLSIVMCTIFSCFKFSFIIGLFQYGGIVLNSEFVSSD